VQIGNKPLKLLLATFAALGVWSTMWAEDLTIHLPASASVSRKVVRYQCDAEGSKMGVPSGPFPVEYINGGGNSLAIVPISGNPVIFSNVISGSGARYTAQQFTWWDAKGTVRLYAEAPAGKLQSACHPVQGR